MSKQHTSKSTLFLMELVIVIFFFSICAAICVNVFSSGQIMARDSHNLSNGVLAARSAASCYKSAEGDLQKTAEYLDGQWDGTACLLYYDSQWQPTDQSAGSEFVMRITEPTKAGEAEITVQNLKQDKMIFQLQVKSARGGSRHENG